MIYFQFDNSGNVVSQSVTLSEILDTPTSFAVVLGLAVSDHATLENSKLTNDDFMHLTYSGNINELYAVDYVIVGQNNNYQISISYHTY